MRIGIISDTHIKKHPEKIVDIIDRCLGSVDMIIHAGDYSDSRVVSILKRNYNFVGVFGNVDSSETRNMLCEKEIIDLCGYRIGIFHGHGDKKTTIERAYEKFKNDDVDIIVFGHSHQAMITAKNRVLMLNPGSITYKRKDRWFSYIMLELNRNSINAEIKFFI